ncbi:MAG: TIGR02710 family CRISPR-associated CARF protein [Thermoplasmata archaeon]
MSNKKVEQWRELMKAGKKEEGDKLKKEIFEDTKQRFREKKEKYDIEILTVGNTAEPLILSILALKPDECVFICTPESRKTVDAVCKSCNLNPSAIIIEEIQSRVNAEDVYERINKHYTPHKKICIDITGGTKAMVGGAAIAGAILRLPVFYVNVQREFNTELPYSEELVQLKDPLDIFMPVEDEIARKMFDACAYSGAVELFGECIGKVKNARRRAEFEVKKDIANAYMLWDRFDYLGAWKSLKGALEKIERFKDLKCIKNSCLDMIRKQRDVVKMIGYEWNESVGEKLKKEEIGFLLIVDMFLNAERRAREEQYSDGIIRLYRTLELIAQLELVKHGVVPDAVDDRVRERYAKKFRETTRALGAEREIPKKVSLLDAVILLYCMWEDNVHSVFFVSFPGIGDLADFQKMLGPRNTSIVVHGMRLPGKSDYENLRGNVYQYIEKLIGEQKLKELESVLRHRSASELFD